MDQTIFSLLERCSSIYVTSLHKEPFFDKSEAFYAAFRFCEKSSLLARLQRVELPLDMKLVQQGFSLELALSGSVGRVVEGLFSESNQGGRFQGYEKR